jgi:hypothetical protein
MTLKFHIITLFILISEQGHCQINEDSFIIWSPHYKLKIVDFKDNPKTLSKYGVASTACGFDSYRDVFESRIEIFVFNTFSRYKSARKYDSLTEYDINHEQRHFDLYEIYVRKLRALVIKNYKSGISSELFTKLKFQYQRKANYFNDIYDKETRHGDDWRKQAEWNKKIDKWLKELDKYADPKIVIYQKNGNVSN